VGDEYFRVDDYDEAMLWYERALLINPSNVNSVFGIGLINERLGDWLSAIDNYEGIISIEPSNAKAYYKIGEILYNQFNHFEESLFYFYKASEYDNLPVKAYVGIGDANYRLGNNEDALSAYKKAVDLSYRVEGSLSEDQWKRVWPHYALGSMQFNLEQYDEAQKSFLIGLELDTNDRWSGWLLWGLGRISLLTENYDQSREYFTQILEVTDYIFLRSQAYYGLGLSSLSNGEIETGLMLLRSAIEEHPQNRDMYLEYIRRLIEFNSIERAKGELQIYLKNWPEDKDAQDLLSTIID
jgi:tetratricopeptide (TPR) repeat protein